MEKGFMTPDQFETHHDLVPCAYFKRGTVQVGVCKFGPIYDAHTIEVSPGNLQFQIRAAGMPDTDRLPSCTMGRRPEAGL